MNNKVFYSLVSGFTLGIFISSFLKLGFSFFLFLLILAGLIFAYGWFFAKRKSVIILLVLFIFSFGLGILRYELKDIRKIDNNLENLLGEKVNIQGIVSDEPTVKDKTVQLIINDDSGSKVLVSTDLFPEFKYGDKIKVKGKLEKPENFETDTGKDFDYIDYLAKEDIFYQISFAQGQLISSGHGFWLKEKLFAFKNAFMSKINLLIKEPESSLLGGLLLGAKNSLGKELQTDFRVAGVSHIVALSGYNITIVAVGIMAVLGFLSKTLSLSFGVIGILLFAIMTGGTATVMRASIMAILVLLAKGTNRKYEITRALLIAFVFMLIQNPRILVFDISFQLSFLATVSLIYVAPIMEKRLTFITEKYALRELTVSTIATQIFVLPFLIYKMGLISVFGLFANILILPVISWVMLFGFLTGITGFISLALATPLAFLSSFLLSYILKIIYIFSHLPFSSLMVKSFPLIFMTMIYGIFLFIIWRSQKVYEKN